MFQLCSTTCKQLGINFNFYDEVDSTNLTALNLIKQQPNMWQVVIAKSQLAGRGRRGKTWHSPSNTNLYFSVALPIKTADQTALSLTVGVSLIDTLQTLIADDSHQLGLKWPNDILLNEQKVAGILLESTGSNLCVIGIGINVNMTKAQINQDWTSLNLSLGQSFNVDELANLLILNLKRDLTLHFQQGFIAFKRKWLGYHLWHQLPVKAIGANRTIYGTPYDVTPNGELVLMTESGTQLINSGEVSLRRP